MRTRIFPSAPATPGPQAAPPKFWRPAGGTAEILAAATKFYSELSPETKEFWEQMMEQEMMDLESRTGKAAGGYCTGI